MKFSRIMSALGGLALLALATPGFATILDDWGLTSEVYTNGNFGNWNDDTVRTETGVTGNINWAEGNNTVPENTVFGPGPSGGERYDIEFLAWRVQGNQFQILGITSIDPNGTTAEGFRMGDVFINTGNSATANPTGYDYAVSNGRWTTLLGGDHLNPGDGLYDHTALDSQLYQIAGLGDIHGISNNQGYGFSAEISGLADPFAIRNDPSVITGANVARTVENIGLGDNGVDNWAVLWALDLTTFQALLPTFGPNSTPSFADLTLHWTVECGNDWIDTEASGDNEPSIPEPATLALFGLGVATLGLLRRRTRSLG